MKTTRQYQHPPHLGDRRKSRNRWMYSFLFVIQVCLIGYTHAEVPSTRVGIVYSELAEQYFGNQFEFRQLYTAIQAQSIQAGVPFELLEESDLADLEKLKSFKAIIVPGLQTAEPGLIPVYQYNLKTAMETHGVSLIAADSFFTYDQSRNYQGETASLAMDYIFGLKFGSFGTFSNILLSAQGTTHVVADLIETPNVLAEYDSTFYQVFIPSDGNETEPIAWLSHDDVSHVAIQSGERGNGKFVHYSDIFKMVDSKILWTTIMWAVSDDNSPDENIALSMTREKGMFIPRNDMDLSRFLSAVPTVEIPLFDILDRWKRDYQFKGSFYINIGNDQQIGEFTDWDLSGPLYKNYMAIGNEIGTHSYTHPQDTKQLTPEELEFEFQQSKIEIGQQLEMTVTGTGIPGEDENLFVYDNIKSYFDYISGHTLYSDSRHIQSLGIGYLTPNEDTVYFSLNMTPDFVLGDILKLDLNQFSETWIDELEEQSVNMRKPVLHWLWHDYGIINQNNSPNYGLKPYEDIVAKAAVEGLEFVTLDEYVKRFKAFQTSDIKIETISDDESIVEISGADLGGLTIELPEVKIIKSVDNYYAYNNNKVFLPENGGTFTIKTSGEQDDVSRIVDLETGLNLMSVEGNGSSLDFAVSGQGKVTLSFMALPEGAFEILSDGVANYFPGGAEIDFKDIGQYSVSVRPVDNLPPFANDVFLSTNQAQGLDIELPANDFDGYLNNMVILAQPQNGTVTLNNLDLTYNPYPGFTGFDTIIYEVTDNEGLTDQGLIIIEVIPVNLSDGDPSYNYLNRKVEIDGNFAEWAGLEKMADDPIDFSDSVNKLDYTELYLAHNESKFFMFYRSSGFAPLNWAHNTFIDGDGLSQTGFILGSIGADILVQGKLVYRYTGNGLDWSWEQVSNIIISQYRNNVELCLDRSLFPNSTSVKLAMLADNSAYEGGNGLDIFPDNMFSSRSGYFQYNFFSETTNTTPVGQAASYTMNSSEELNIVLKGFDMDGDSLSYSVTELPTNGVLTGDAPNLVYTPMDEYTGNDSFKFIVSDEKSESIPTEISISVDALPVFPDKMSNQVNNVLFVDGDLSDWSGVTPYAADPIDQQGVQNALDWVRIRLAHSPDMFYLAYENKADIQFNWAYNLYIDTDLNKETGFHATYAFTGIGAEYLIQSDYVFRYTGNGLDWSWEFVGSAQSAIQSNTVEMSIPRSLIGSPEDINIVAYGENFAYPNGDSVDVYPDNAASESAFLSYNFGTEVSPLATKQTFQPGGPIPPLVPHTVRVRFVEPFAINPGAFNSLDDARRHYDIRMTARPNSTWDLLHSSDLSHWRTLRSWKIIGTWSEFAFPIDNTNPKGGHGFFDALESAAPTPSSNDSF